MTCCLSHWYSPITQGSTSGSPTAYLHIPTNFSIMFLFLQLWLYHTTFTSVPLINLHKGINLTQKWNNWQKTAHTTIFQFPKLHMRTKLFAEWNWIWNARQVLCSMYCPKDERERESLLAWNSSRKDIIMNWGNGGSQTYGYDSKALTLIVRLLIAIPPSLKTLIIMNYGRRRRRVQRERESSLQHPLSVWRVRGERLQFNFGKFFFFDGLILESY